jgi:hypothetical protein
MASRALGFVARQNEAAIGAEQAPAKRRAYGRW